MDKRSNNQQVKVLDFILQDAHICIELQYVNKILPLLLLETVPSSPHYFVGLINLAGKTIPVIDLALRLGMSHDQPYSLDTPILLCCYEGHQAGFIVDKVIGLNEVDNATIQMHEEFNKTHSPFNGTITLNEKTSLLLNMSHIFPIVVNEKTKSMNFNQASPSTHYKKNNQSQVVGNTVEKNE